METKDILKYSLYGLGAITAIVVASTTIKGVRRRLRVARDRKESQEMAESIVQGIQSASSKT